jgi:hypothetical protein
VSLLNAERLKYNKTTIGWLNPTLYNSSTSYFNDITSGYNKCCAYSGDDYSSATCCDAGFYATSGWDPVTGMGSISYPNFLAIYNLSASTTVSWSDDDDDKSHSNNKTGVYVGITLAVLFVVIVAAVVIIYIYFDTRKNNRAPAHRGTIQSDIAVPIYDESYTTSNPIPIHSAPIVRPVYAQPTQPVRTSYGPPTVTNL